jgi:hypothetical protein
MVDHFSVQFNKVGGFHVSSAVLQVGSLHHMPSRPSVPQIVKTEVQNLRSHQCMFPGIIKTGAEAPVKGDYPYSAAVNLAAARYLN